MLLYSLYCNTLLFLFLPFSSPKDFRSQLTAKQPEVDSLLSLGREIVAEPQTSTANDDLETRLTGFIQDWSDLQLAWQNWYDELHARRERSGKMGEELGRVREGMRGARGAMAALFPARVQVETLPQDLQHLQVACIPLLSVCLFE